MLYEDNETRFKGAKLVLTPDHKGSSVTTPGTPVTPSKTMKEATLIRDDDASELSNWLLDIFKYFIHYLVECMNSTTVGCVIMG
jgi:hypothetical protein